MGREKLLLAYPCMITRLCFTAGVQELLRINQLVEHTNITNLGLIRNTVNPMAKQERQGAEIHKAKTKTVEVV